MLLLTVLCPTIGLAVASTMTVRRNVMSARLNGGRSEMRADRTKAGVAKNKKFEKWVHWLHIQLNLLRFSQIDVCMQSVCSVCSVCSR